MSSRLVAATAALLTGVLAALTACSSSGSRAASTSPPPATVLASPGTTTTAGAEKPAPVDSAVPGDIPDTQAFVTFRSDAGHFSVKFAEGWAQQTGDGTATFSNTLNTITVTWKAAASAPTTASAASLDVPELQRSERAFQLQGVKAVTLPAGPGVQITYQANSTPNTVTGKQYRLDVERFELYKGGTQATLTLSSPSGADNVDPWKIVSQSFTWL